MTAGTATDPTSAAGGRPLKLALYHPWIYLTGGAERVLLETLDRSRHDWTLFTHHHDAAATFDGFSRHRVVELAPRVSVDRSIRPLAHAAATMLRTRLPLDGYDGLLISSEGFGDLVLAQTTLPAAVYCHTPLKIIHDRENREELTSRRPGIAPVLSVLGPAFDALDRTLWRRYRHVMVNSSETRDRVARARLAKAPDIEVLHPGVDLQRFPRGPRVRADQLLVAGRIMWQKNIELAIDAFAYAVDRGSQARLIIAGAVDRKSEPYLAALRERAAGLDVRFVVGPTDHELSELYRTSRALLFTPRNEDWGIVPLEAMASGTPVIAIDRGGPRESIVDGVTGWLLPDDVCRWGEQILELGRMGQLALAKMGAASVERAEGYSWDAFVDRIDRVMSLTAGHRAHNQLLVASSM